MRFICNPDDALLTYTTASPSIDEPSAGILPISTSLRVMLGAITSSGIISPTL